MNSQITAVFLPFSNCKGIVQSLRNMGTRTDTHIHHVIYRDHDILSGQIHQCFLVPSEELISITVNISVV